MTTARLHLGLDLGGTNIKWAVVETEPGSEPRVIDSDTVPTYAERGPPGVIERLSDVGREVAAEYPAIVGLGIGVPGLFDPTSGAIELFPNLPGPWAGQPMRDPIARGTGLPVTLSNDARAFTLAEGTIGAGRGCSTLVCLTLGTGIGGGVMINGKIHLGAFGRGGEIAHQTVLPDGPMCGCGNRGCAEALARADVLAAAAGKFTVEDVYAGVKAGDKRCIAAVEAAAGFLGIALANMVTVLGPERIVIGGGIVEAGDLVLDPIRRAIHARVTLVPVEKIPVVSATLGPIAGAIGAALASGA
jgi:glucokinase